tara:strand:- start:11589 stop:11819 length:231 start_codon:yes stop_codon:yes gene_type:complete
MNIERAIEIVIEEAEKSISAENEDSIKHDALALVKQFMQFVEKGVDISPMPNYVPTSNDVPNDIPSIPKDILKNES